MYHSITQLKNVTLFEFKRSIKETEGMDENRYINIWFILILRIWRWGRFLVMRPVDP